VTGDLDFSFFLYKGFFSLKLLLLAIVTGLNSSLYALFNVLLERLALGVTSAELLARNKDNDMPPMLLLLSNSDDVTEAKSSSMTFSINGTRGGDVSFKEDDVTVNAFAAAAVASLLFIFGVDLVAGI
jgi:hypothetical protein